ncbi:MAG: enoyl-CoA hydratase/isomerase family protein, partial [Acidimicrobiales bacterium]
MSTDHLLVEDNDSGVRLITLNRPDKFNSWNAAMRADMRDVIEDAAMSSTVRV